MGHPGTREHDRMCFVGHDASPGEKRSGTMMYILTTTTYIIPIAQLRFRVCGVGSSRGRGLLKDKSRERGLGLLLRENEGGLLKFF